MNTATARCAARATAALLELLTWHPTQHGQRPDADMTVLLWTVFDDGSTDWASGWWDGEHWRDCESGGQVGGDVRYFAAVNGPGAAHDTATAAGTPCTCHTPSGPRHCPEHCDEH